MAPEHLVRMAKKVSAGNAEPHPSEAHFVRTTRRAAVAADSGARVDANNWVYLVALRGHFVARNARVPNNSVPLPAGTVLTFTIDTATGAICDFGISEKLPDLSRLGRVADFSAQM